MKGSVMDNRGREKEREQDTFVYQLLNRLDTSWMRFSPVFVDSHKNGRPARKYLRRESETFHKGRRRYLHLEMHALRCDISVHARCIE